MPIRIGRKNATSSLAVFHRRNSNEPFRLVGTAYSYRIRPNLTLNYGIRWDYVAPWAEKYHQTTFWIGIFAERVDGILGVLTGGPGKTSIRLGGGRFVTSPRGLPSPIQPESFLWTDLPLRVFTMLGVPRWPPHSSTNSLTHKKRRRYQRAQSQESASIPKSRPLCRRWESA